LLDKDFSPLPTYPLVLLHKGDDFNVNDFRARAQGGDPLPGVPAYNPDKIVHGEQSLTVHTPFPIEGGRFNAQKTCTGVFDKGNKGTAVRMYTGMFLIDTICFHQGSGMVIETTVDLYDEQDKVHYCTMVSKSFVRGYGGWNVSLKQFFLPHS
jgi:hypothetical protein